MLKNDLKPRYTKSLSHPLTPIKKSNMTKIIKPSQYELALLSEQNKKFDSRATKDDCISDLRKVQEANPYKAISRNFYRCHGRYSDSTWNQFFGTFHEFRRQAKLELSRDQHSFERKIAKHASLDVFRDFYRDQVLPYHQKHTRTTEQKGRYRLIAVASDFHDIDVDKFVLATFVDSCKRLQPDVIVLNGDVFDNYEMSRFDIDPRHIKIKERFDFVRKYIFGALRNACPKAEISCVCGNHEIRLLKLLAEKTPNVRILLSDVMGLTLSKVFGLDEFGINLIAKLDLAAFTNPDIQDELKENYVVYYDAFAACHYQRLDLGVSGTNGHTHKPTQQTFANVPMGKCTWTQTGCMAKTYDSYTEGQDRNVNSFMFATVDLKTKLVAPTHYIITGGFAVIEGKLYTRPV